MLIQTARRVLKAKLSNRAFTLIELVFTFAILATCILGILLTYISMFILLDLSRDITLANNAVQAKVEEIKNTAFTDLPAKAGTFNLTDYGFPSADSKGVVEVQQSYSGYTDQLTRVRILGFFRSRGRVIGEDTNLNGALNTGEDRNGNNLLDSPIEVITLIAK